MLASFAVRVMPARASVLHDRGDRTLYHERFLLRRGIAGADKRGTVFERDGNPQIQRDHMLGLDRANKGIHQNFSACPAGDHYSGYSYFLDHSVKSTCCVCKRHLDYFFVVQIRLEWIQFFGRIPHLFSELIDDLNSLISGVIYGTMGYQIP
jgi:hypothetical protein